MSFSIVIPYRAGETRDRALNALAVARELSSLGLRMILAEDSLLPDLELILPKEVVRVHRASDQPFNKAAACNLGFLAAKTDALAFVDADMVIDKNALLKCLERVHAFDEVIRPFGSLTELSEEEALEFRISGALPGHSGKNHDDSRGFETIPACGGAFVIRSERFLNAGGMDERFQGWGGEDNAFESALRAKGSTLKVLHARQAFHLWHPRSVESRYKHPYYQQNLELAKWWETATNAEMAEQIAKAKTELELARAV